jgi:guanylate kinase
MNELKQLATFKKVLADYHISNASKDILRKTELALLVAPTSAGRNTIIRELIKTHRYHYIISDTTRQPRINNGVLEQNGVEYWFRTEDDMLADLVDGQFLEAAIIHNQQVSGISVRELKKAHDENKTAVTDIEIMGVETIIQLKPDTIVLFVLPPNFKEWLSRIKLRGEMHGLEYRRRVDSALKEFKAALEKPYYSFVINDQVVHAVEQIHAITQDKKIDLQLQHRSRLLAKQLYQQTQRYLKELG